MNVSHKLTKIEDTYKEVYKKSPFTDEFEVSTYIF